MYQIFQGYPLKIDQTLVQTRLSAFLCQLYTTLYKNYVNLTYTILSIHHKTRHFLPIYTRLTLPLTCMDKDSMRKLGNLTTRTHLLPPSSHSPLLLPHFLFKYSSLPLLLYCSSPWLHGRREVPNPQTYELSRSLLKAQLKRYLTKAQ